MQSGQTSTLFSDIKQEATFILQKGYFVAQARRYNIPKLAGEPGTAPDSTVIYYSGVCRNIENFENAKATYEFGGEVFEKEDLPIAAQCQKGLAAGLPAIIIGENEPIVQFWHKLWNELLASD